MRVLFWGTPDFAVPSLRALAGEGHDVAAIVTQPDRPAGRGRALRASSIKAVAADDGVPVLQPDKPLGDAFLAQLREIEPEVSVVVAYGQILRREILDVPTFGSINLHASLLPELRGAAPINWAIARGHDLTGITVIRMVEKMDAGPMLLQVAEPIGPDETATDLKARLSEIGAEALVETLALMEAGEIDEIEQDETRATFAPRILREHTHVDWTRPAIDVGRQLRAFDAVPGAWSLLDGQQVKLFRPLPVPDAAHQAAPGTVLDVQAFDASEGMLIACGEGAVWVREVKPAGKQRMPTAAWVRGRGIVAGQQLA